MIIPMNRIHDTRRASMIDSTAGHRQFSSNHIEKKGEKNTLLDFAQNKRLHRVLHDQSWYA